MMQIYYYEVFDTGKILESNNSKTATKPLTKKMFLQEITYFYNKQIQFCQVFQNCHSEVEKSFKTSAKHLKDFFFFESDLFFTRSIFTKIMSLIKSIV
jgi:hypothetical protein